MASLKLAIINARKYARDDNIEMLKNLQSIHGNEIFKVKEDTKDSCILGAGPKATRFLLELGVDPTLENYKGENAISYAAKYIKNKDHYDALKVLAEVNTVARELIEEYDMKIKEEMKKVDPIVKLQQDVDLIHIKLDEILRLFQIHTNIHHDKV